MRKFLYHQIWIQNYLGFIVLDLMFRQFHKHNLVSSQQKLGIIIENKILKIDMKFNDFLRLCSILTKSPTNFDPTKGKLNNLHDTEEQNM